MNSTYYHPKHYYNEVLKSERSSASYRKWRRHILKRDGYRCILCGSRKNLHAHHIKLYSQEFSTRLRNGNGITLCKVCHINHHRKKKPKVILRKAQ